MKTSHSNTSLSLLRSAWLATLLLALPLMATAQSSPTASGSMQGMDMGSMPDMTMPAPVNSTPKPASKAPARKAAKKPKKKTAPVKPVAHKDGGDSMKSMDHNATPGMDMDHGAMPGMNHGTVPKAGQGGMAEMGAMPGMTMGPMQGGSPPPDARSPDYSDGVGYGDMRGMDMYDKTPLGMLLIDQLEVFHGRDGNGQSWEAEGWYGNDSDKLWVRTEGERSHGKLEDGDLEAFWNHNIATYWSTQLGARQDIGTGPNRSWAAFGVQGIAPYWFDLEATGYVGPSGRTAARLRAEYELLFTQRLILQPELETNLYGKDDPQQRIGSGVSDVQFGMRLRYEFQRQFAPYIGVNWLRRTGVTAEYARQDGQSVLDRQIVVGLRVWF
ncbi:MAG: copper resistance protein B [Stenotrophobium sp.]